MTVSRPRLSLCMIVRDNETILGDCLGGIRPWVDEMIVVDTGSNDRTAAVAEQAGARVFHFPWCDDFSAARNESLRHASGDWLFWMDSDDTIDAENGAGLRRLVDSEHEPDVMGYVMQVRCPNGHRDGILDETAVDHVKLFRNHPELRFELRIHEQILPSIHRAAGRVVFTNLFIRHSASDQSPDGAQRKFARDLRLLHLELRDRPDHPFGLFNLGMTYGEMGLDEHAADALRRCLSISPPFQSHVRKAYALLVNSLSRANRLPEAMTACAEGRQAYPDDPELLFREGLLAHRHGDLSAAVAAYRRVINRPADQHFSSMDVGIVNHKLHHNLAGAYADLGRLDLAEIQWRQAIRLQPDYRPGWWGLLAVLLRQRKMASASILLEQLSQAHGEIADVLLMRAEMAQSQSDLAECGRRLAEAIEADPHSESVWQAWCKFLFEFGTADEAEAGLRELLHRFPLDAAALHNLGTVYFREGRFAQAVDAYRDSLQLRPNAAATWRQLGFALTELGQNDAARQALEESLELQPSDESAQTALNRLRAAVLTDQPHATAAAL